MSLIGNYLAWQEKFWHGTHPALWEKNVASDPKEKNDMQVRLAKVLKDSVEFLK